MDIIDEMREQLKQSRIESFGRSLQITLGELTKQLLNANIYHDDGRVKSVSFDFGTAVPSYLHSWRGSYEELSLGYNMREYETGGEYSNLNADELLVMLKRANGNEYTGWKGGEYIMDEDTPMWCANEGHSGNTGIIGILDEGYSIIILTAHCEF